MTWHRDKEVNRAFVALMDALVSYERNTGRRSKLFFFPEAAHEDIIFLDDGKPVKWDLYIIRSQLHMIMDSLRKVIGE